MMAFRIPPMPLTTAVMALPMARKTDLIWSGSVSQSVGGWNGLVGMGGGTYAGENGTHCG